ncbi:MAG: prepilin-type N-terminal cleavage/methylation domain-containing protein [Candidatus Omnitrophica bacterium]|nr:prepilin-type N-terminal cleavage/methylation domain-containing protein [Candidatus Omnitrophota bacterium]
MPIRQDAYTPLEKAQTARPVRKFFSNGVKEQSFLTGYTLMELLIVIIVICILTSIAWPSYTKTRIKSEDKEAYSILFLLQSAEKNYKLETGHYYGTSSTIADINSELNVYLPNTGTRHWDYWVYNSGCVQVNRRGDSTRKWHLSIGEFAPLTNACGS